MLSLAAVSAGYGSMRALFDVSLDVTRGEAVGVIGPNGAGKTTLMRVISGLIPLRGGAMTLEGRPVGGLNAHRMVEQGIAHVPENRRLFPRLTVEDNLRIGAFIPQARAHFAEQIQRIYDLFPRLKDRREQLAGTLSGGEQQMCAIGRGLMARPSLLIIDELSLGLAPNAVELLAESLAKFKAEGISILLVKPDVMIAFEISDYGYVLESGRIAAHGRPAELLQMGKIRDSYLGL